MASSARMSRDDFRKQKELEELRKTGAAPPAVDEDGKMINPHVPHYMAKAPWYTGAGERAGLKHQYKSSFLTGNEPKLADVNQWYERKPVQQTDTTKVYEKRSTLSAAPSNSSSSSSSWRPGACDNCGSLTHKTKECVDRPRRLNSKLTKTKFGADEIVPQLIFTYDGKRDRYAAYDREDYKGVLQRYEREEDERKRKKAAELEEEYKRQSEDLEKEKQRQKDAQDKAENEIKSEQDDGQSAASSSSSTEEKEKKLKQLRRKLKRTKGQNSGENSELGEDENAEQDDNDEDEDDDEEEGKELDEDLKDSGEMIQHKEENGRMTVRNLRIREDVAKYLRNLNPNSAYYDPKTHSMRENPYEGMDSAEGERYKGDNFYRYTGEVKKTQELEKFVWDAREKGEDDVHAHALPSMAEKMYQEFQKKKELIKQSKKKEVMERYGVKDDSSSNASAPINLASSASSSASLRPSSSSATSSSTSSSLPPLADDMLYSSESYVEYDASGRVMKGAEKVIPKSKYEEDRLENGHSEIFGSYYDMDTRRWGYSCCLQIVRNAVCTGKTGKAAKLSEQDRIQPKHQNQEPQSNNHVHDDNATLAKHHTDAQPPSAAPSAQFSPRIESSLVAVKQEFESNGDAMNTEAAPSTDWKVKGEKKAKKKRKHDQHRKVKSESDSDSDSDSGSSDNSSDSASDSDSVSSSESDSDRGRKAHKKRKKKDRKKHSKKRKRSSSHAHSESDSDSASEAQRKKRKKKEKHRGEKENRKVSAVDRSSLPAHTAANTKTVYGSSRESLQMTEEELDAYQKSKTLDDDPLMQMRKVGGDFV